jgi:hypothetical protein
MSEDARLILPAVIFLDRFPRRRLQKTRELGIEASRIGIAGITDGV